MSAQPCCADGAQGLGLHCLRQYTSDLMLVTEWTMTSMPCLLVSQAHLTGHIRSSNARIARILIWSGSCLYFQGTCSHLIVLALKNGIWPPSYHWNLNDYKPLMWYIWATEEHFYQSSRVGPLPDSLNTKGDFLAHWSQSNWSKCVLVILDRKEGIGVSRQGSSNIEETITTRNMVQFSFQSQRH